MVKLNDYIEKLEKKALYNFNVYLDMLYIQAVSEIIDKKLMDDFLQKRGYISKTISGKSVMIKGFTCVFLNNNFVEIWHDIPKSKPLFINQRLLTALPLTLDYMERV